MDFGIVAVGERPKMRPVTLGFTDGSQIGRARIITESGLFWFTGPAEFRDVSTVDLRVYGQPIAADTPTGQRTDKLRVQMDEVTVSVTLLAVIVPAPPPEPVVAPKQPRRHLGSRTRGLLLGLVLALVLAVVALVAAGQPSGPSDQRTLPAAEPASGTYCSVKQAGGVISYYLTSEPSSQEPVWSVMVPGKNEPYQAWWTPAFPYWERANAQDGFTHDGHVYGRYEFVEVLVRWGSPWEPLNGSLFNRHDFLDASVEAAKRTAFISEWSHELGSSRCA
ncbi:hypothetical protein OG948_13520 [Embleya sp. NBC_00888]|uniref:hypothetical protein n=1 Tax=Embleya sp. NBC_00888 TaxID=2975960 RepID=UPI003870DA1F|nr:hypothetical protein OG948_13520 [Embleya sp. NBC_00888]